MYAQMVFTRLFDQRVWVLNRQGKIAIATSCQGHEAAQIGSARALDLSRDLFFIYYRDIAVSLALGVTPREMMASFYGKASCPFSGGRQVYMHGKHSKLNIFNVSNVVSSHLLQAVGAAMAAKIRGEESVVIAYFGDGATSSGDCHEAMNFAGIHKLPVIFFCENNEWAISVPQHKQMAIKNVSEQAVSYGIRGVTVDGIDLSAVHQVTQQEAARMRQGEGPCLIEAKVARLTPHTTDDGDRYRGQGYVDNIKAERDPLKKLKEHLKSEGLLDEAKDEAFYRTAQDVVDDAVAYAESAAWPEAAQLVDHVYVD